ncbi:unnamed protein product [Arabidopsis lyrata]|nr:unnamed protein product [Arabidopsis lyrata]
MEKGNGSKPSLSSLMSSLYDSLNELTLSIDGDVRKKLYIPKGKISSFFYFATLFDNKMTISEIETLQRPISLLTEVYTNMAMRLHPELFSEDTNPSLIQEDANNGISPEAVVVVPSPAEEMQQNNQIQNEPEPLRRESKTDSLVTEDG